MAIKASVTGQAELAALARRLKEAGDKGLKKELGKGLKKAAKPAVAKVQAAVRALDVRGTRGGGKAARLRHKAKARGKGRLRETIARATIAEVKTTGTARVTIRTRARNLPPDQRRLPRYLDREKGWRHPVFGNREVWVSQRGGPYFSVTLRRETPAVRTEVIQAMRRVASQIVNGA